MSRLDGKTWAHETKPYGLDLERHTPLDSEPIDRIFDALGHPIRRKIVAHLASSGQASITDLAAPFDVSLMAISKHVKVLREAAVLTVEREGRTRWCSVNFEALRFAREWLDHNERVSRELGSG